MSFIFGNFLTVTLKMEQPQKLYLLAKDEGFDETLTPIPCETTTTDPKNEKTENGSQRSNSRKCCLSIPYNLNF